MEFSLFYFADDATSTDAGRYRLLLDGARFADAAGLTAVWTPERHFHPFGGLYPNPAVTAAAVAAVTRRVGVRAGSVVLPLHDPLRVAEEWSVIDNLSGGRAGIAFASGWHAVDFALHPRPAWAYNARRELLVEGIDTVRRLWRGERVSRVDGGGAEVEVGIFPAPVQPELPFWCTSSGNPRTFETAGRLGANVLTHLLGQSLDELASRIDIYQEALRKAHPGRGRGHVTVMVHTYLGADDESVLAEIREPFSRYLASSADLLWRSGPTTADVGEVSRDEVRVLVDRAFTRYSRESGLFGSLRSAQAMVGRLAGIGVDEAACLIDFGVARDRVVAGLDYLGRLAAANR